MDECGCERASRDYRMKFPDEILLTEGSESLNGQIWFGAECLSAGSNILNHHKESTMLRPMAKTLTTHLDSLRTELRELVIDGYGIARIGNSLIKKMVSFDHIFATFEYEYVRTMLPIRTVEEIEKLQEVAVLFSETLIECVKRKLIKEEDIAEFEPIVMIAIPRLAIVRGLLYENENPIYMTNKSKMSTLFQPFHGPLKSIRKLLKALQPNELFMLEKMLANDETADESNSVVTVKTGQQLDENNLMQQQELDEPLMNEMLPETDMTVTPEDAAFKDLLFRQSQQLLHRLFVAISGVADQLQSNFASDLRFILKHIFSSELNGKNEDEDINSQSPDSQPPIEEAVEVQEIPIASNEPRDLNGASSSPDEHHRSMNHSVYNEAVDRQSSRRRSRNSSNRNRGVLHGPPIWVPDQLAQTCSCCDIGFNIFRRRHHCRNCGQIFCGDCSKYTMIIPRWGYNGPVRVCESCYSSRAIDM